MVHKVKNFVQGLASLVTANDAVLDITVLRAVAAEMMAEDKRKYGSLHAALEKKTDMQSQAALCFLVTCRAYHDRLLLRGHLKEFAILQALGMAWLAYDLHGLSREHRTYFIELIQQLLVFNVIGDRMFLPGGTKGGEAMGVRASHFGIHAQRLKPWSSHTLCTLLLACHWFALTGPLIEPLRAKVA